MQCCYATARRNGQAIDLSWNSLNAKHIPTLMRSRRRAAPLSVGAAMRAVAQPYGAERSRRQRIGFSRRVLMPRTGHAPGQGYAIQPG
jgi:hypothetical protein